jgi:hypothetical protein
MRRQTIALLLCLGCLSGLACQTTSETASSGLDLAWLSGTWKDVTRPEACFIWSSPSPTGLGGLARNSSGYSVWKIECRSGAQRLHIRSFASRQALLDGCDRARTFELVEQTPGQARFASIEAHSPRFIEFRYERGRASSPTLHLTLEDAGNSQSPNQSLLYQRSGGAGSF